MIIGVNDHPLYGGDYSTHPGLLAALGAGWVRVDVTWPLVEPSSGSYSSGYMSQIAAVKTAYNAAGLRVLWVVVGTPSWANGGQGQSVTPTDPATFATMMAHLASTFPGETWELYNEPDGGQFFLPAGYVQGGNYDTNESQLAVAYVPIVQAAYSAMKTADPTCTVIAGVLGSTPLNTTFYGHLVSGGMVGHYDAFSIHNYYNPTGTPDPTSYYGPQIDTFQAARASAGDHTPLWVTEVGWPAAPTAFDPLTETGIVSQSLQAQWALDYYRGLKARGDITALFLYNLIDTASTPSGTPTADQQSFYGLAEIDGSPKVAYAALRAYLTGTARHLAIGGRRYRWSS